MKKKTITIVLTGLLCSMIAACGSTASQDIPVDAAETESTAAAAEEAESASAQEETEETAPEETAESAETEAVELDFTDDFLATFAAEDFASDVMTAPTADDVQIEKVGGYKDYESYQYLMYVTFGANGLNYVKYYTANTVTGELLTLDELLGSDQTLYQAISDSIMSQMEGQMQLENGTMYFIEDYTGVNQDSLWYLDINGMLTIVFPEATIAAHSEGIVEFTIPGDVFDPTSVL